MPRSDEAENWFLQSTDWLALADHPFIFSFIIFVLVWVFLAGTRSIIGEYFKLFWFRRVHTPTFERAKAALTTAREDLEAERTEFDALKASIGDLMLENDRLLHEVLQLKANHRRRTLILSADMMVTDDTVLPSPRTNERPSKR